MNNNLWCITVFFNPARYKSRMENFVLFRDKLNEQNVNLLTVELAFDNDDFLIPDDTKNLVRLRGGSVLWQKERLINYGLSLLPDCKYVAWLDADLLFPDHWVEILQEQLEKNYIVQLFETVSHLDKNRKNKIYTAQGVGKQSQQKDWLWLRQRDKLPWAETGYGWACRREIFPEGLYDRLILGSGDACIVDCFLRSESIHHYNKKLTKHMEEDVKGWKEKVIKGSVGHLPVEIYHLWHGSIKNRNYQNRDLIWKKYDFNPKKDIKLVDGLWTWASDKPELHQSVAEYFHKRREDE